MSKPWIIKHVPSSTAEIYGQSPGVELIKRLVTSWTRRSKPIWIWGTSGTGKTVTAHALADELNLELVEVNASDSRNASAIDELLGGAIKQGSLFGTSKLILIDEVDGLSGNKDRGGIPALIKVIKGSSYPVIITGLNPYDKKFSSLRKVCELVEFSPLPIRAITDCLSKILDSEKISYSLDSLQKIARSVDGDVRAAINDAQTSVVGSELKVDSLLLGTREHVEEIENALLRIFKTTDASFARGAFDSVDEDINKIMMWVDHNVPLEYSKVKDLQRAFDALGEADKFLGRIRRWQHYRFYVYAYDLLTAGIAVAKDDKYKGVTKYSQSSRILQIWIANQKNAKKRAIAEKVAVKTHTSTKRAMADIPFLQQLAINNPAGFASIADYYDLDREEVAWLKR